MLTHFLQIEKEVGQSKHIFIKSGSVAKANHLEKGFFFFNDPQNGEDSVHPTMFSLGFNTTHFKPNRLKFQWVFEKS